MSLQTLKAKLERKLKKLDKKNKYGLTVVQCIYPGTSHKVLMIQSSKSKCGGIYLPHGKGSKGYLKVVIASINKDLLTLAWNCCAYDDDVHATLKIDWDNRKPYVALGVSSMQVFLTENFSTYSGLLPIPTEYAS